MISSPVFASTAAFHFAFSPANQAAPVSPETTYTDAIGYGFEPQGDRPPIRQIEGGVTCNGPFYFSTRVEEGNYRVTVTLGQSAGESDTTIKAECRRLIALHVKTAPAQTVQRTFTVNVRSARINGDKSVQLAARERQRATWDDKLTLEFNGPRPSVQAIDIQRVDDAITVFIAGDSTVCDQPDEPWIGWGQMLPAFFNDRVAVANYAESGRALFSFRSERRLDKILSVIKPGDYLLIQFGHNDQKDKTPGSGAFTTYKRNLEQYIAATRERGATPVLITPMYRRRFDAAGVLQESLGDFPEAVRKVAKEQNAPLIDLHEMSGKFFQAMGAEPSTKAFVHYPANTFPGQTQALKDDTHFNTYGGYELARCVVEGIRTSGLPLAKELSDDVKPFDPSRPDEVSAVDIPPSPASVAAKPEGN